MMALPPLKEALLPKVERALAWLLVLGAVVFAYLVVAPILEPGYIAGGDDVVHMAFNHEVTEIIAEHGKLFGWSYLFGLGAPIFLFRPPLIYFCVGIAYHLLGGNVPISLLHKIAYLLCLCLYPICIYYMMRKFAFRPLYAAIAAVFAITPISMWGHTIDAYFRLGIAKQLIAITLFPLALGKLHGTAANRESILGAALLITLSFISHPYMPFCLLILCVAYGLVVLASQGWRGGFPVATRLFLVWALSGLLLAFWLLPHYTSPEIQMTEFSANWRHGFEVICGTIAQTVNHYVNGGILDTTRWGVFGGGAWGWQSNTFTGRWPMLTAGSLLGILVCLRRRGGFQYAFMLLTFAYAFLLFLGPDDVPWLDRVPFQNQFQYIHAIFLLDLAAMAMAGIGFGALLVGAANLAAAGAARLAGERARLPVAALLVLAGAVLIAFSPYRDRWLVGQRIVRLRPFDTHQGQFLPQNLRLPANRDMAIVMQTMRDDPVPGRFFGAPQGAADGLELSYFTVLPAWVGRTDVICGFFSAEVDGVNKIVNEYFRKEIPLSSNLVHLLDIRYLVCARSNRDKMAPANAYADLVVETPTWHMWRVRAPSSEFALVPGQPLVVVAELGEWRDLCRHWMHAYQNEPDPGTFPYLVYAGAKPDALAQLPLERFAGVVLAHPGTRLTARAREALTAFAGTGGRVLAADADTGLAAAEPLPPLNQFPYASFRQPRLAETAAAVGTVSAREHHAARLRLEEPGYALFKTAYYRGWRATANGQPVDSVEISPGFSGVYLPAGDHDLHFRYQGPNYYGLGRAISLSALLIAFALEIRVRRRPQVLDRWPWIRGDSWPATLPLARMGRRTLSALLLVLLAYLAHGYVREHVLRIPVLVRPIRGAVTETDVALDWNRVRGGSVTYDAQVFEDTGRDRLLVYERSRIDSALARGHRELAPDTAYRWRVRSHTDGVTNRWSREVPFRTAPPPLHARFSAGIYAAQTDVKTDTNGVIQIRGLTSLPDGARLTFRVYREDTDRRFQSSGTTVRDGEFTGSLAPPPAGWPAGVALTLYVDGALPDQRYPVTGILGERGTALAAWSPPPGHTVLHGLYAETRVPAGVSLPTQTPPSLPAHDRFAVEAWRPQADQVMVRGRAHLPNQSRITIAVSRANAATSFFKRTAEVREGRFEMPVPVDPGEGVRVQAFFSPEDQYDAVRAALGPTGHKLLELPFPEANRLHGFRAMVPLGVLQP